MVLNPILQAKDITVRVVRIDDGIAIEELAIRKPRILNSCFCPLLMKGFSLLFRLLLRLHPSGFSLCLHFRFVFHPHFRS